MIETMIFLLGSALVTWYSRPHLRLPVTHGFFRFFVFEGLFGLIVLNLRGWFSDPLAPHQVASWVLLGLSIYLVVHAVVLLHAAGTPGGSFEQTTHVVRSGIYRFIRHPMYASLLCLAWAVFLKSPSLLDGCLALVVSAFVYATAVADERECLARFGSDYAAYMRATKRFIPFIF